MPIKDDIKSLIVKSGWTMSDLVKALNEKYNRDDSVQNLSGKLSRGTIKYREALEIAEILGYEIQWIKK
ncbi:MAG: LLM class flavin-dependent oxidoreductase [Ruminiclostridium sp.]